MEDAAEVRRIIDRNNAEICRAYAAGDVDAVAAIFAEDCWQMPPHSPPSIGRDAVREFWREATGWGRWNYTIDAQELLVGDGIAVERGAYTLQFEAGPAAPPGMPSEDSGNYLVLWRRDGDGEWRALWDAPVSDRPIGPD